MHSSPTEYRETSRVDVRLAAVYTLPRRNDLPVDMTVLNLSPRGMCFRTGREVPVEEPIDLTVTLASSAQVPIRARAVWCRAVEPGAYMVGVRIVDPIAKEFDILLDYYSERLAALKAEEISQER